MLDVQTVWPLLNIGSDIVTSNNWVYMYLRWQSLQIQDGNGQVPKERDVAIDKEHVWYRRLAAPPNTVYFVRKGDKMVIIQNAYM